MARIVLTPQLERFTAAPEVTAPAADLRAALDACFAANPLLRGYLLDDQGHVRKHVVVFVDGEKLRDRADLAVPLAPDSEVYILQALSGG